MSMKKRWRVRMMFVPRGGIGAWYVPAIAMACRISSGGVFNSCV
jgi:hypothetical protein